MVRWLHGDVVVWLCCYSELCVNSTPINVPVQYIYIYIYILSIGSESDRCCMLQSPEAFAASMLSGILFTGLACSLDTVDTSGRIANAVVA